MKTKYWMALSNGNSSFPPEYVPFGSLAGARDAFRKTARDLIRFDQAVTATVHIAESEETIDEYPNFTFRLGPRGGLVIERL